VLDCACGPGHLAVGSAQAGFVVTATDASAAMTSRTVALAECYGVTLTADRLTWEELADQQWHDRVAAVLCVGNSIAHAEGPAARRRALRNIVGCCAPAAVWLLTSRNWELVRSIGLHLDVADRVVARAQRRRPGHLQPVLPDRWTERHRLDVAVALFDEEDVVHGRAGARLLARHEELLDDLAALGLRVRTTTYASEVERYLVVAHRGD